MTLTTILVVIVAIACNAWLVRRIAKLQRELDQARIKHFSKVHFTGVTLDGMKFVYCPVGNIISWSEGDYHNKWCHFEQKHFTEVDA